MVRGVAAEVEELNRVPWLAAAVRSGLTHRYWAVETMELWASQLGHPQKEY
ncbi:MAG: hypothetical protein N3H31_04985 [Candidatus Nezhaarchaeota archaeon]|nr:hypothetical protein [Candidatus Nezhaarchaeota archaeon]